MRRRNRNPRHAYENGKEIPPPTVSSDLAKGIKTVAAHCEARGCDHHAAVPLAGWPLDLPIPDIALKLRCSKCGSREVKTMMNMTEHYQRVDGVAGYPRR